MGIENTPISVSECQVETQKHIEIVRKFIRLFTDKLTSRGVDHDKFKLESPEVEIFAKMKSKLKNLTYGTPEYEESLNQLKPALDHHYANCRHHPEHFKNGVNDMNLIDLVEMLCDWKASSLRQHDGNLLKSIETNAQRFGINKQLTQILVNTAALFEEI